MLFVPGRRGRTGFPATVNVKNEGVAIGCGRVDVIPAEGGFGTRLKYRQFESYGILGLPGRPRRQDSALGHYQSR